MDDKPLQKEQGDKPKEKEQEKPTQKPSALEVTTDKEPVQ